MLIEYIKMWRYIKCLSAALCSILDIFLTILMIILIKKSIYTKRYQIKKTIATIVIGMNTLKLKKIVCKIKMFLLEIPQDWRLFQCWSSGLQALKSN